ncbi:ImmA/IrrE family metallo-endopeptidase [Microbacterium hominis]|uniref:ImmA/IrrE family metallo-endopeptidase n=1 Tax=Microbacterium TaxID=33882 RepID=UPI00168B238A|nr:MULTISPECIES: ImmA/IrrE family metallo-endopeptidase [Microbacterium]QOC24656.1 ImmA/IrrE family metallo-endopeptidase [Microbacterium hominis]QOC28717.1 ImmA/IrrE family metallo-endopeptidase [Microbacterium hominis]QYF99044.1 ImmA/IrrE family metallo-endopeptidase [Microbacterium sp. PAMC21962]
MSVTLHVRDDAPRWASPPGETIRRLLETKGLSTDDLADALGISDPEARRLILGEIALTNELAAGLASMLGSTPEFWCRRDAQYRESLNWLRVDDLVRRAPIAELRHRGWLADDRGSWQHEAATLLEYFGVEDAQQWTDVWTSRLADAHYRTSSSFESDELAVAAWLRRAEMEAARRDVASWSPAQLRASIPQLRSLSKIGDPQRYLPQLSDLLARVGVALVVVQPTKESRVSGAAFRVNEHARAIALSARYLAEDHLWFTLFHEIGHLLLHGADGEFLDEIDVTDGSESATEREANEFARSALLPAGVDELRNLRAKGPTAREITRFAARHGVAPGVVVGRLHFDGVIDFRQQNKLIRRYRWSEQTLTQKT